MADPALTPALALDYLDELATDIRAAVVLDAAGEVAAASPDGDRGKRLGALVRELLEGARAAAGAPEDGDQVEVGMPDGSVFAVRGETWAVGVVAGRYALSSLMFYDLRNVVSDLGDRDGTP